MSQQNDYIIPMETEIRPVSLKNRWLAALLAWLFPGLGHFYQGRTQKGILFFLCLTPLIVAGLWMGSYWDVEQNNLHIPSFSSLHSGTDNASKTEKDGKQTLYFAKDAYFQWEPGNKRLYFIPQALNATIAVPAYIQAKVIKGGNPPLWNGAFAPPAVSSEDAANPTSEIRRPTLNELLLRLHSWFDLGSIFLAAAGLLNLLVIFDALCGPAWILPEESDEGTE